MSFPTLSIPVRTVAPLRLSRKEEMRRLRRAHRIQVRRRKLDALQYRYRHVMTVSTSGFFAIVCIVISHTLGLI